MALFTRAINTQAKVPHFKLSDVNVLLAMVTQTTIRVAFFVVFLLYESHSVAGACKYAHLLISMTKLLPNFSILDT